MFVRYQTVRNGVMAIGVILGCVVVYIATRGPAESQRLAAPNRSSLSQRSLIVEQPVTSSSNFMPAPSGQVRPSQTTSTVEPDDLMRRAMTIAMSGATADGGKDILGTSSPWKLNLYDDDGDGVWDRGKLDTNRDEVDDQKWTFKQGRWERSGGAEIWDGNQWVPK